MFVRALVDFMFQQVLEWLMPSLDWTVALELLVIMLILRLCAQVLGCFSVMILMLWFLLS